MLSSLYGLRDLFNISNQFIRKSESSKDLLPQIIRSTDIEFIDFDCEDIIILPPSLEDLSYFSPSTMFLDKLRNHHLTGGLVCSICAGANILAQSGILDNRFATTHWIFEDDFALLYPAIHLNTQKVVVEHTGIITAGGLMSWIDLGLTLIARLCDEAIMREVARYFYAPALPRTNRDYLPFYPKISADDYQIAKVQQYLHQNVSSEIQVSELASISALSQRTFHRRFIAATNFTPFVYLQKLRVQKACDYLQVRWLPVSKLAEYAGYKDIGAFSKVFKQYTGLTPKSFFQKNQSQGSL